MVIDRAHPLSGDRTVRDTRIAGMTLRHARVAFAVSDGSVQAPADGSLQVVVSWADYIRKSTESSLAEVNSQGRISEKIVRFMCAATGFIMPWAVEGRFAQQGTMCMLY